MHIGNNNPGHIYSLQTVSLRNSIENTELGTIVDHELRILSHFASIARKAHQRSSLI